MEEFVLEILSIIKSDQSIKKKKEALQNYHENDIAEVIPFLDEQEISYLFKLLDKDGLSEVISYAEDAEEIIENLNEEEAADILEEMDADDAVDILENLDEEDRADILSKMEEEAREDAELILSYEEDTVGRLMTTNYIVISKKDTIVSAMKKLIQQSGDNDNISTIFVVDEENKYYAAIDLKDLIRTRKDKELEDICLINYPSVLASAKTTEIYQDVIDYGEDLIPVIDDDGILIGVITAHDLVEVIDEEMSEDYQKIAAISGNVDLDSNVFVSLKKRAPWLILLLVLGFAVSMLISSFGNVISSLTTMVFFQSVVLGMAGNAGTQSLAVTIRILSDEDVNKKLICKLIFKELRVGLLNGLVLGLLGFVTTFLYLIIFKMPITIDGTFSVINSLYASLIIAISLLSAMTISSMVGTLIPTLFHAIKVDPAVASGPLITTINDLTAVAVYYGLCIILMNQLV